MKRPRREIPSSDGDPYARVRNNPVEPYSAPKRPRPERYSEVRSVKMARVDAPRESRPVHAEQLVSRKYDHDFATIGVNYRYVSKRVAISTEVCVSTVYVNHRLYKLKAELLNMVGLLADFGLYWEALSMETESHGGRRAADMFVRFIQGASSPQELLHAITTLETVIPLAGMTRGEHRDAIELMIFKARSEKIIAGKSNREPFPLSAATTASVAARLYSLDRIIRYEKLPNSYTDYMSKSVAVSRSRCDQSARCPFSLCCSKAAGHFGRCFHGVDAASRIPDIRPAFDRMVMGEIPYQPDHTTPYLNTGSAGDHMSMPLTQFSNLPGSNFEPMSYDPDKMSKYQMSMDRMNRLAPHYAGTSSRYTDRYELVTVKILPFDISEVQPHYMLEEFSSTEWV